MSESKPTSVRVGAHEFESVSLDTLRFTFRGDLTDAEAAQYLDFVHARANEADGLLYTVYDLSALTRIDEKARRRITNIGRPYPFAGLAVIGANFTIRALAQMIIRAIKIIKPEIWSFPHKFVANQAEADAWIDELRKADAEK